MNGPAGMAVPEGSRAEAQRERILCAAQRCFIERGFHAASMANIADTAGMSAGLMYRYFENKNAIVLAIIDRHLAKAHESIRQLRSTSDLAASLYATYLGWKRRAPEQMNPVLFLETSAEAARDPQVGAALRASDSRTYQELKSWLMRPAVEGGPGLPATVAGQRALMLQLFFRGLAVGAVRSLEVDDELVRITIEEFVERWLAA